MGKGMKVLVCLVLGGCSAVACSVAAAPQVGLVGWVLVVGIMLVDRWLLNAPVAQQVASLPTKDNEQDREEWCTVEERDGCRTSYFVHFRSMSMLEKAENLRSFEPTERYVYRVKRNASGAWERILTEDSAADRLRRYQGDSLLQEMFPDEYASALRAPEWSPIDSRLVPAIETAYQRYIRS